MKEICIRLSKLTVPELVEISTSNYEKLSSTFMVVLSVYIKHIYQNKINTNTKFTAQIDWLNLISNGVQGKTTITLNHSLRDNNIQTELDLAKIFLFFYWAPVFCTEWGHLHFKGFVKYAIVNTESSFFQGNAWLKTVSPQDLILSVGGPGLACHTCNTMRGERLRKMSHRLGNTLKIPCNHI